MTMATYKVKLNQNILDIALELYGTIEGVFDLLITNTGLSMNTDLKTGQELEYHEDFILNESVVTGLSDDSIVPANGERHVYYKRPEEDLLVVCDVSETLYLSGFVVGGEGTMIVDWGDNSELDYIELSHKNKTVSHYFDNTVDNRRIKIYGNPETMKLTYWDTSDLGGALIMLRPVTIDEYVSHSNGWSLSGLFLFDGTYRIDLQTCTVADLLPIGDLYLQELNLLQVKFLKVSVLDEYLQYIVANYGTRGGCTVYLDTEPSEAGMEAINTILKEEEWNTPTPWKFIINDKTYTYSA